MSPVALRRRQERERKPPAPEVQSAPSVVPPPPAPPSPAETAKTKAAVGELNLLASLIGSGHAAQETFKLENLFGHDIFTKELLNSDLNS